MRIGDIASRSIVGVDRNDSLSEASVVLAGNELGALLVYDSEGPVGIFSERDLVQAVADGADVENTRVREGHLEGSAHRS